MRAPAIDAEDLVKRFGEVSAVDRVSFSVAEGTAAALLGSNGAGKTTMMAMLLGLLTPTSGRIRVLGHDPTRARPRQRALARMNFSSPYVELPARLTVRENLVVYGHLYGVPGLAARIEELARDLELEPLLARKTGALSAGQRSRVALAKSLVNRPSLLLLDEPTASLDPDSADRLRGYLDAYRRSTGATILLASHNMAEVERLCSDVIMLRRGRVADRGSPEALIARYGRTTLEEVFLDIARGRAEAAQ